MIVVGLLLNVLCQGGLSIISWIIVFVPFVLMTVIVAMLLYIFGLNATTGRTDNTFTLKTIPKVVKPEPEHVPCKSTPHPYHHGFSQDEC